MELQVTFPTGEVLNLTFYVTPLDSSCSAVLGYNWLRQYNLLVDWSSGHISFHSALHRGQAPSTSSGELAIPPSDPFPTSLSLLEEPLLTDSAQSNPHISFINAATYQHACKLEGSQVFQLSLSDPRLSGNAAKAKSELPIDLSSIPEDYHEFTDVFNKGKADSLPPHRPSVDLKINIENGAPPPPSQMYSLSNTELEALQTFIEEHVRIGFICPSNSHHGAPILFVHKKDGSLCLCIDYRGLNKITKKDRYPLPLISDLLDTPRKACLYTKIDLRHAYHLVHIAEGDEWKTTFCTRYGSFEWLVMPFGLSNAPAAFQRYMNKIFADMLDVCVIVYLDDILIYSDDMSQHQTHVKEVLRRLCKHGLYATPSKCEWHKDEVEYLGYILTTDGLCMDKSKIQTILDWPEPRKVKDVQSFLGFCNFYCHFIFGYCDIIIPLTWLTHKNTPWNFDKDCGTAFKKLKEEFTHAPILTHWVPDASIIVETDASDYALAAILSTHTSDGDIHPVAFHSCSFNPRGTQLRYP